MATIMAPRKLIPLESYGSKVWIEWDERFGVTFYRSETSKAHVNIPTKKDWAAFDKWHALTQGTPNG